MILNFLKINNQHHHPQFQIDAVLDWAGNCAVNRVWYRGDGEELNQLYRQMIQSTQRFWATVPTSGIEIRKLHTGLPREIVEMLSGLIVADLNGIELENPASQEAWERIAKENDLSKLVTDAL